MTLLDHDIAVALFLICRPSYSQFLPADAVWGRGVNESRLTTITLCITD